MKLVSCTAASIPESRSIDTIYIAQYENAGEETGYFGLGFPDKIRRGGIAPSDQIWDFVTFAFTIAAVDKLIPRETSPDGWTREFEVDIHLSDPETWNGLANDLQNLLRFLTGDFWSLHFYRGGYPAPRPKTVISTDADCVSLLSGGMDSLLGGIDLTSNGRKPLFASHIVNGSRHHQEEFAHALNAEARYFQWSYEAKLKDHRERSTRGRSIVFFALAAIASSVVRESIPRPIEVFVPENGFISLNMALSPGRLGSLSTKTTHPIYMQGVQSVWDRLGIQLQLRFPYRYQTKGEMLENCRDKDTLHRLLGNTISCSQYHMHKHIHCGVCIPCLVRRAAYRKVGWDDPTEYCKDLRVEMSDNIAVATSAWLVLQDQGIRKVTAGSLSFAKGKDKHQLEQVVSRGLTEISDLLRAYGRI